ncbi:MAG: PIN domain-containing protein [Rhodoferax sp.]|nr:PIN domain-containing protein [Rhodoferax sp.]
MILVDSNVLIDVMTNDARWCNWSLAQLRAGKAQGRLAINHLIYAELAVAYETVAELDSFLKPTGIIVKPLSTQTAFLASRAFMRYRRTKGIKTGVLPDFFIGAQAEAEGWTLLTRDATRYRRYFPGVELICP